MGATGAIYTSRDHLTCQQVLATPLGVGSDFLPLCDLLPVHYNFTEDTNPNVRRFRRDVKERFWGKLNKAEWDLDFLSQ
jgi:hypothetical protein